MLCEGYFMITSILYTARCMDRKRGILICRVLQKQRRHRHHHRHLQQRAVEKDHIASCGGENNFLFLPNLSSSSCLPMSITIQQQFGKQVQIPPTSRTSNSILQAISDSEYRESGVLYYRDGGRLAAKSSLPVMVLLRIYSYEFRLLCDGRLGMDLGVDSIMVFH